MTSDKLRYTGLSATENKTMLIDPVLASLQLLGQRSSSLFLQHSTA
jgi:hypothetical protein